MQVNPAQYGGVYLPLLAALAGLSLTAAALNARTTMQGKAIQHLEQQAERQDVTRLLHQIVDCQETYQRLCIDQTSQPFVFNRQGRVIRESFFEVVDVTIRQNGENLLRPIEDERKTIELEQEVYQGRVSRDETWGIKLVCDLDTQEISMYVGRLHARGYNLVAQDPFGRRGKFHRTTPLCDEFDLSDKMSCPNGVSFIDFGRRRVQCAP